MKFELINKEFTVKDILAACLLSGCAGFLLGGKFEGCHSTKNDKKEAEKK